jgi:ribulose 1,5-bisphosphate synthetase/thiazole synthase
MRKGADRRVPLYLRFRPTTETTMTSQTQDRAALSGGNTFEVPVLIVGGGGAGLTASMLLSQLGVEHLLVSALPTTSILPKAHVLNQKTMEILADVGVADEISKIPHANWRPR